MEEKNNKNNSKINRRDFFKLAGAGTFASAAALYGCSGKNNRSDSESAALGEIPTDKMVYRTNPTTGDRVSLLGYGCMRWPTRKRADGNGDEVDQEAVNELIDYAIAHGVNYFDTSTVYVQGWSEKSTGIALKRHPREKFLIATKLSNFSNYTRENSIAMYRKSFEDLQVDYIDYYLLHSVGNGGIKTFRARYIDNGMIDFLMEERKAGRIRNLGFSFHGTTTCLMKYWPCTTAYTGISCKSNSTMPTGGMLRAIMSMPNICMANSLNATYPPLSWNRCWEDGYPD